jgi:hypothetical protein
MVALAAIGEAEVACGKVEADLSILDFEWET